MSLTPSQADVLRALEESPGRTPDDIGDATSLPPGGVHWNLDRLEGLGFVEHEVVKVGDDYDGSYRLTDRGLAALRAFDR
jgi:DNA-binding MarR family transcriptional regulator